MEKVRLLPYNTPKVQLIQHYLNLFSIMLRVTCICRNWEITFGELFCIHFLIYFHLFSGIKPTPENNMLIP
jgi:hypothetical protein